MDDARRRLFFVGMKAIAAARGAFVNKPNFSMLGTSPDLANALLRDHHDRQHVEMDEKNQLLIGKRCMNDWAEAAMFMTFHNEVQAMAMSFVAAMANPLNG